MKAAIKKSYSPNGGRPTPLQVATKAQATLPFELALTERTKELNCLQQMEQIIAASEGTLDDILWQTVEAIPKAWLHSANTVARITKGSKVYQTGDLDRCQSVQSAQIKANDHLYGLVEVGYTERFDGAAKSPFLAEERVLLDTIAIRLGSLITRAIAEEELIKTLKENERLYKKLLTVLGGMAEMRDPYTAGHQQSVDKLALAIGVELGLPVRQLEGLQLAASVHDIGKIMVPAEILCKPTKLTRHEYDLIKDHAQAGYDILKDVDFPWPIARIVLEHHERMDGSGYPNGIPGDEQLLESRIVAVADVVQSMCAHRPYRAGLGSDAALAEITKNRGKLYDPEVVDACLRLFNEKRYVCGC
ncbi:MULTISPECIES: HD-GYP domain-containing protein [unclassified Cyanobium]|uniref:HD-GYP domain-containing protein n=1 Tax=unclassified Cyanobium TaxID=2627006 RepID=UPI0020CD04E0|nr:MULTISPECIES: HD-GYP domain-containing protein [unclassified Cyanobium]MCP9833423.1 HD-GYP domain-containing protein [Cyanobium sp. La Preciosa 7G6]MCP9936188.1 HD-GYP domain-containing protein [Cyanobium sp. Aljojuca 7A6]